MKNKKKQELKWVTAILMLTTWIIFLAIIWAKKKFKTIDFASIVFYINQSLEGTNVSAFHDVFFNVIISAPLLTFICMLPVIKSDNEHQIEIYMGKKVLVVPLDFYQKKSGLLVVIALIMAILDALLSFKVPQYMIARMQSSTLYDNYYIEPATVEVNFPTKKRNLIYIFMESMELSYTSREYGGLQSENLIPEMVQMALENECFAEDGKLNGPIAPSGTTWTVGSMVAQTAGIHLYIPSGGNTMEDGYADFLPGAYSIGQILEKEGYHQIFLLGSDAQFGGRRLYMTQHGNYELEDYNYAVKQGWIDPQYYVFWGFEDKRLYEDAKEELLRLSTESEPFNLTMLTVDTHFFDGYYCSLCETKHDEPYSDVMNCASRQINEFVKWVQQQDFYEDTTVIVVGDHPTMDDEYIVRTAVDYDDNYVRKNYLTIINSACDKNISGERVYTLMDMYPTTLASLGCTINGERMGLGTNLYSDQKTLAEIMGIDELNIELDKNSKYYNQYILYGEKEQ